MLARVSITSNNITSRTGNSDLVLEAAGSGKIYVPTNSVQLDQNLTVNGTSTFTGTETHNCNAYFSNTYFNFLIFNNIHIIN